MPFGIAMFSSGVSFGSRCVFRWRRRDGSTELVEAVVVDPKDLTGVVATKCIGLGPGHMMGSGETEHWVSFQELPTSSVMMSLPANYKVAPLRALPTQSLPGSLMEA